ncbi:MAG: hypothetical protein K2X27_27345 [Candidatus Obscuribacterales bacterium]|nr:hypothetical protein [Candidatus Obscuribacterales bacterium]
MKFHSNIFGWEYVWRDFADSKGGRVESDSSKENDPIISMHIPVEGSDSVITFTPHAAKGKGAGTSASIHYAPKEHFSFVIKTEKGLHQIAKALGMQDIQLGDQTFDSTFLIQGTDEGKVRNLFSDMHLRSLLVEQPISELRLAAQASELPSDHPVPNGRHAVYYGHEKVLDKFEQLEAVFTVLTSVVHRLGAMPAIAGEDIETGADSEEAGPSSKRLHSPLLDMA